MFGNRKNWLKEIGAFLDQVVVDGRIRFYKTTQRLRGFFEIVNYKKDGTLYYADLKE